MWRHCLLLSGLLAAPAMADVDLDDIRLPPGFSIEVYADVDDARSLALGGDGVVFVGSRGADTVSAIFPGSGGRTQVFEIDDDLYRPHGVAYKDGDLYVAEIDHVYAYRGIDGRLSNPPRREQLNIDLPRPNTRNHQYREIGFDKEGRLVVAIGAPCNVCDLEGFGIIDRMQLDGSERETIAYGVRNSVGIAFHPETGDLWFTDNGRDMLGDDIPPDELNHLTDVGQHFGFPYCHGGYILDAEYGEGRNCDDYTAPAQPLGPHVASLGLTFYTGDMFPEEYRNQIFIAEHGSWNRSEKIGYRITLVRLEDGVPVSYEPFAVGWHEGQTTYGRPVDLLVLEDGSMLVSDDYNGTVYRITWQEPG